MPKRSTDAGPLSGRQRSGSRSKEKGYLDVGRVNQKLRTRDALVTVAADFIRRGRQVSVAEVADLARVSRTTAYRYFPTQDLLHAQAALFAAGSIETDQLDALARGSGSPEEKVDAVIVGSDAMTTRHDAAFRAMLRLSLGSQGDARNSLPRRPSYRRTWLSAALSSLRTDLGEDRFDRLVAALSLLCGIEAAIVLQDICRMKPAQARELKRWAARHLLHAAVHEAADVRAAASARRFAKKNKGPKRRTRP
jgi:AcrR family transcriptional regulator